MRIMDASQCLAQAILPLLITKQPLTKTKGCFRKMKQPFVSVRSHNILSFIDL
ncbi:MAG: hypothetical protein LBL74_08645 [Bacteroidales bacterium]|nr:hypothetical protein [Bacteroidales bacterium]